MKIISFRSASGADRVGVVIDNEIADVTPVLPDPVEGSTELSPIRRLLEVMAHGLVIDGDLLATCERVDLASVSISPVVPDPSKIVAAPVNYRDHQNEMNEDYNIDALGVFLKAPSSVIAEGGVVQLPYLDRRFDQEGELAVVIGRTACDVAVEDALDVVAGYTCLLDITMRGGEDRSTRKSFDSFTPVGPWLVTSDEVGPLDELRLRTTVSGVLRQDADIADLIWGVPELVSYASSVMTLLPGDIVTTGTPAGVGQLHDGDSVRVEIDRIGALAVSVSSTGARVCPTRGAQRGPKPPEELTPVRGRIVTNA